MEKHDKKTAFMLGVMTVFKRHGKGFDIKIECREDVVNVDIYQRDDDGTKPRSFFFLDPHFERPSYYQYGADEAAASLQRLGAEFETIEQAIKEANEA